MSARRARRYQNRSEFPQRATSDRLGWPAIWLRSWRCLLALDRPYVALTPLDLQPKKVGLVIILLIQVKSMITVSTSTCGQSNSSTSPVHCWSCV